MTAWHGISDGLLMQVPDHQFYSWLIGAVATLSGVIALLGRVVYAKLGGDITKLESKVTDLDAKLDAEVQKRQESDLKALRAEIVSQLPCGSPTCPKLASVSLSIGEALRGGTGTL